MNQFQSFFDYTLTPTLELIDTNPSQAHPNQLMIYQNEPMKLISERMGHSKITTTMDTYGHLMPNM